MAQRLTHCFASGCTTGYVSAKNKAQKASLFAVPHDDERRRAWQHSIPRADKPLEKSSVVCEAHFDERFIVRNYTHVINGETVEIPCDRPCLTADAIPALFSNIPAYLSKKLPSKRKSVTSNGGVPRKQKRDDVIREHERIVVANITPMTQPSTKKKLESMKEEYLPSKYWAKHAIPKAPNVVAFPVRAPNGETLCFQKLLLCSTSETSIHCTAHVQGSVVTTVDVDSADAVKDLLSEMDTLVPCEGFEMGTSIDMMQTKTKHKTYAGFLQAHKSKTDPC
ncbi:uncharacterized protein LOC120839600 [Ixodes scapularis]|uniref:uncharacterized protein LOC120839600 n=1 Tax=Ixodes scapularis TaxID=6945 RepID=UPI001A9E2B93|nr:uncharacterized protein LOC120839600 [Ixodes scapularis]